MGRLYEYFITKAFVYRFTPVATKATFRKRTEHLREVQPSVTNIAFSYSHYLQTVRAIRCTLGEYLAYDLFLPGAKPETYITMYRKHRILSALGDRHEAKTVTGDKRTFNRLFADYLHREWLDCTDADAQTFIGFVKKHGTVICKKTDACQGIGIEKYTYTDDESCRKLYNSLHKSGLILEECIVQHPKMSELYNKTVNSIRVSTLCIHTRVAVQGACVKMGLGDDTVDNFYKGGIGCPVDVKTGIILADAFDHALQTHAEHPVSGTHLQGFRLPMWDEVLHTVTQAAIFAEQHELGHWIGWDIAILPNGVAIIEGNWNQGVNLIQSKQGGKYPETAEFLQKEGIHHFGH